MSGTTSDRLRRQKRRHADNGREPCRPLKLVLLGDSKVGTTSLIHRFIYGTFNERVERTITVDEMEKKVTVDGRHYALHVVDTAGQTRFRSLRSNFYRGIQVCLLTFALDDLSSFCNLSMWREEFLYYAEVPPGAAFPFIVIGNKADVFQRAVSDLNVQAWCRANGDAPYLDTSAKNGLNVEEVFDAAVRCFLQVEAQNQQSSSKFPERNPGGDRNVVNPLSGDPETRGSSACCS